MTIEDAENAESQQEHEPGTTCYLFSAQREHVVCNIFGSTGHSLITKAFALAQPYTKRNDMCNPSVAYNDLSVKSAAENARFQHEYGI